MIHNLDVALELKARYNVSDFFVSQNVFLDVVRKSGHARDWNYLAVDRPCDSPQFRFVNKACWRGISFVYLSNEKLAEGPAFASACA